jgi:hypothetical protein
MKDAGRLQALEGKCVMRRSLGELLRAIKRAGGGKKVRVCSSRVVQIPRFSEEGFLCDSGRTSARRQGSQGGAGFFCDVGHPRRLDSEEVTMYNFSWINVLDV